jgi:hypothetical protein
MIPVNVAVLSNGFRPYPGKVNAVRSVWFGYVTVAAEYGQDILMKMRLNIQVCKTGGHLSMRMRETS